MAYGNLVYGDATMTSEEIRALPAGRELDALMAVRLFGWRWLRSRATGHVGLWGPDPGLRWTCNPDAEDVTGREAEYQRYSDWDRCGYGKHPDPLPSYSTDATAA